MKQFCINTFLIKSTACRQSPGDSRHPECHDAETINMIPQVVCKVSLLMSLLCVLTTGALCVALGEGGLSGRHRLNGWKKRENANKKTAPDFLLVSETQWHLSSKIQILTPTTRGANTEPIPPYRNILKAHILPDNVRTNHISSLFFSVTSVINNPCGQHLWQP